MEVIAIDPGTTESAYTILEFKDIDGNYKIVEFGKIPNIELRDKLKELDSCVDLAIEMVASYGMAVGKTVFQTVFWTGIFWECSTAQSKTKIYRKEVKMHLCSSMRAKDSNIIRALVDRFADQEQHGNYGKGTKKNNGYFFGFSKDHWQSFAVGVTYLETDFTPYRH